MATKPKDLPDDFYQTIRRKLYRRIGRSLGPAHRILDLGCGRCELVKFLRTAYRQRVTGVDVSDGKLPRHDLPSKSRAPLRCIKADASCLDFLSDASMDAVVTVWALHEMSDAGAAAKEAHRVLRPGGKILAVDFPRGSLAQRLWDEAYLRAPEVGGLLSEAGFERVRARTVMRDQVIWASGFRPPNTGMKAR